MSGLLLRLGGPLQSWGTHSAWTERDTHPYPTRSGLIGLIAASGGHPRTMNPERFSSLRFLVRIDRPGTHLVDFHTVGGGRPSKQTVPTAKGGYRQEGTGTLVSNRHYLSDAVFTVAVTSSDGTMLTEAEQALRHPYWAGYLGRRACPPDTPFLITAVDDPHTWLHQRLPLARPVPHEKSVTVEFVSEHPPDEPTGWTDNVADDPRDFTPDHRSYHSRPAYRYRRVLPAGLCGGYGTDYLDALSTALEEAA
ncbi:type I-E CRISPR-associated protein Cas5/CasD [Actinopolyspora mortivallis]|uniref:type I-E CRISPR-associated protein Cas5/CasD n=1 Tax=Actinopolyspora mortivallis TaxID=33906 RepID=UPI00047B6B2A|nr:type I-E CRISPR-associated protein Cas5/CasD [Actinopolyspora mortivallis]